MVLGKDLEVSYMTKDKKIKLGNIDYSRKTIEEEVLKSRLDRAADKRRGSSPRLPVYQDLEKLTVSAVNLKNNKKISAQEIMHPIDYESRY